jgi:hypothetical protein
MSFEIVSERRLTDEEIGLLRRASALLGSGYDRRELLKLAGLSGAVIFTSFTAVRPARALVPVIVEAVAVTGKVFLRYAIPAAITLYNIAAQLAHGSLYVEYRDSDDLVAGTATLQISIGGESKTTISHKGFTARKVGDSTYEAKAADSSQEDQFEVLSN